MTPPSIKLPGGGVPKSAKVRIVRIESLDAAGNPLTPPEYQYGVATWDNPPQILFVANSYSEAAQWAHDRKYHIGF